MSPSGSDAVPVSWTAEPSVPLYGPPAFAVGGWLNVTVLWSVAKLLPAVVSVALVTVAVLSWLVFVEDGTVYFAVIVAEPPAGIVPSEQVKLGEPVHVPCDGMTMPRVKPAGHVSLTFTETASEGPA